MHELNSTPASVPPAVPAVPCSARTSPWPSHPPPSARTCPSLWTSSPLTLSHGSSNVWTQEHQWRLIPWWVPHFHSHMVPIHNIDIWYSLVTHRAFVLYGHCATWRLGSSAVADIVWVYGSSMAAWPHTGMSMSSQTLTPKVETYNVPYPSQDCSSGSSALGLMSAPAAANTTGVHRSQYSPLWPTHPSGCRHAAW